MNNGTENVPETARERFHRTLVEKATAIKTVRNDVFTVKYWQLALNFVLGAGAVVLIILAMTLGGSTATACMISSIVAVAVVLVFNLALRAVAPTSFLQYTVFDDDKRYCIQILSKNRALFFDGETAVEYDKVEFIKSDDVALPQYKFDFFKDMDVNVRIGKVDREIYKGTYECGGKTYKGKIVFKNGVPFVGVVGGARIKYFDVNSTKEKFFVPERLKQAADAFDVHFPKLPGVSLLDSHVNAKKQ